MWIMPMSMKAHVSIRGFLESTIELLIPMHEISIELTVTHLIEWVMTLKSNHFVIGIGVQ